MLLPIWLLRIAKLRVLKSFRLRVLVAASFAEECRAESYAAVEDHKEEDDDHVGNGEESRAWCGVSGHNWRSVVLCEYEPENANPIPPLIRPKNMIAGPRYRCILPMIVFRCSFL